MPWPSLERDVPDEFAADSAGDVRIQLLGGFRVWVGGRAVAEGLWRLRKARALVKLLALAPGHQLHRDHAIDLLWPHFQVRAANNNLYYALHVARGVLETGEVAAPRALHLSDDILQLRPAGRLWVDVPAFETAARAARSGRDAAAYAAAAALFTGALLPEDRYEDWAEARREHLHDLYLALVVDWARLCEVGRDIARAIEVLQRALAIDPAHEDLRAHLVRLYNLDGQPHQALRHHRHLQHLQHLQSSLRPELEAGPLPAPLPDGQSRGRHA
jgi:DNA-binding SARP family transcriptional activator